MIHYNDKIIAEPGHYLTASNGKKMFVLRYEEGVTYEESEIDTSRVSRYPDGSCGIGGFNFNLPKGEEKKYLVTLLFSNDDQIAIMLNKEQSEEGERTYQFMQEWRVFFSNIIQIINQ